MVMPAIKRMRSQPAKRRFAEAQEAGNDSVDHDVLTIMTGY
jgi:hypothetical protein